MKRKYKLIDRNLIRHFEKISVTLDEKVGDRFIKEGKARLEIPGGGVDKSMRRPPSHKAIFSPPEEKSFESFKEDHIRYPGVEDKLFSNIEK